MQIPRATHTWGTPQDRPLVPHCDYVMTTSGAIGDFDELRRQFPDKKIGVGIQIGLVLTPENTFSERVASSCRHWDAWNARESGIVRDDVRVWGLSGLDYRDELRWKTINHAYEFGMMVGRRGTLDLQVADFVYVDTSLFTIPAIREALGVRPEEAYLQAQLMNRAFALGHRIAGANIPLQTNSTMWTNGELTSVSLKGLESAGGVFSCHAEDWGTYTTTTIYGTGLERLRTIWGHLKNSISFSDLVTLQFSAARDWSDRDKQIFYGASAVVAVAAAMHARERGCTLAYVCDRYRYATYDGIGSDDLAIMHETFARDWETVVTPMRRNNLMTITDRFGNSRRIFYTDRNTLGLSGLGILSENRSAELVMEAGELLVDESMIAKLEGTV